jgi:hypothetical protein
MVFNIRLTLTQFAASKKEGQKESNTRNCLLIADTVIVTSQGSEILTQGVSRAFNDISYNLDDNDNVEEQQSTAQHSEVAKGPKQK